MEILLQLGANKTAFIQFLLFCITIYFLTTVVYSKYFTAYDERLIKTKGADAVAKDATDEAKSLALIYQSKARTISEKIKSIFEQKKSEAQEAANKKISEARLVADSKVKSAKENINQQKSQAKGLVTQSAQDIANQITQKFEGGL